MQLAFLAARRRAACVAGVVLLGLPVLALGFHAYAVRDRGPVVAERGEVRGGERQDLAPGLVHVRLRGEGYALGRQHGALLRPEIREMVRYLREELIGNPVSRDLMLLKAWQLDERSQARYRAEMRGVADGAGVAYADILLINTFDDLSHLLGCSSAVVLPEGGEPLRHARNLDYPIPRLARFKAIFDIDTRGIRMRTVGFPGYIGVLTGMSSRGLSLSSHTSSVRDNRLGTPSGLLYRQVLEESEDLQEMKLILSRARRTIGNNLAVADAQAGTAMAIELDADRLDTRPPEGGRLYVTNHFQTAAMQKHQNPRHYSPQSGSVARMSCLQRSLPPGRRLGPQDLMAAMSERGPGPAWYAPANDGTVQSVIMEPATGRLWVAQGQTTPVTAAGYLELSGPWLAR
ncbi:MAG: C45 family peptidase [Myxococcales bacterium]|nr:C45 family peptidase [Myxococcales bacterium]